jgi:hypothetical protein
MADVDARVCLDSGDLDTAQLWYKKGHDLGLRQLDITPNRKDLWEFRWAHAQARVAARRGDKEQAEWHVGATGVLLDKDPQMAAVQTQFFPYLTGYVASYLGEYKKAVKDLLQANQGDAFIQCLLGQPMRNSARKTKPRSITARPPAPRRAILRSHTPARSPAKSSGARDGFPLARSYRRDRITSTFRYGRRASGTTTLPSFCW